MNIIIIPISIFILICLYIACIRNDIHSIQKNKYDTSRLPMTYGADMVTVYNNSPMRHILNSEESYNCECSLNGGKGNQINIKYLNNYTH